MNYLTKEAMDLCVETHKRVGFGLDPGKRREQVEAQVRERKQRATESLIVLAGRLVERDEVLQGHAPVMTLGRPASIPSDDAVLAWHLRAVGRARPPQASREIATDFYRWLDTIYDAESRDRANLEFFFGIIADLLDLDTPASNALAVALVPKVEVMFSIQVPRPMPRDRLERESAAHRASLRPDPAMWLRRCALPGARIPSGIILKSPLDASDAKKKTAPKGPVDEWGGE